MRIAKSLSAAILMALGIFLCPIVRAQDAPYARIVEKNGKFDDIRQDVADAIVAQGYVIDSVHKIGEMLERTGKDIGATKQVFTSAETLAFCSARLSRDVMEADPAGIVLCPYTIVVYETPDKPGVVRIGYRLFPKTGSAATDKAVDAVRKTLDEIIARATE